MTTPLPGAEAKPLMSTVTVEAPAGARIHARLSLYASALPPATYRPMLPAMHVSTHGEPTVQRGSLTPLHKSPEALVKLASHPDPTPDPSDTHVTLSTPVCDSTSDGTDVSEYRPTSSVAPHDTSAQLYTVTTPEPAPIAKSLKSSLTADAPDGATSHARLSLAPYVPPPDTCRPTPPSLHVSTQGDEAVHSGSLVATQPPDETLVYFTSHVSFVELELQIIIIFPVIESWLGGSRPWPENWPSCSLEAQY